MDDQDILHHLYVLCCQTQVDISQCLDSLKTLGVEELKDMKYVQEADLLHVLRQAETRKLIAQMNTTCVCQFVA
jgi:hypothetical protein